MTPAATTPVKSRFTCSIAACPDDTSTRRSSLQFGQSSQPRPDPVNRTAAPVTTIATIAPRATAVTVR